MNSLERPGWTETARSPAHDLSAVSSAPSSGADHHRISLVIPLYNSAAFIESAFASVAGQSRVPDEVVVVDDASTDLGPALLSRWSAVLPLRVVRHERNQGLGIARRSGIAASTGDLIALLDADDVWLPDHLETLYAAYLEHGGLITPDVMWWSPGHQLSRVTARSRRKVPSPERQRRGILERNFIHPSCLFSRADYERAGGFSELRKMEDWDLWARMVRAGVTVTMVKTPTVLYRIHDASLSARRGVLATTVAQLPLWLDNLSRSEQRVLNRTIRRNRARIDLLAGERHAAEGQLGRAVRLWARAVAQDRRLSGGLTGGQSSVTLQALANLASGGLVGRWRAARSGTGAGVWSR